MTELRDIFKQVRRLKTRSVSAAAEYPPVTMAFDLLDRALEQATRRPHSPTLQQDEYFCASCGTRWGKDEPEPPTDCAPVAAVIHSPVLADDEWHCAVCGAVWPLGDDEPDGECEYPPPEDGL